MNKAVPGNCHGFGGYDKLNRLQAQANSTGLGHGKLS